MCRLDTDAGVAHGDAHGIAATATADHHAPGVRIPDSVGHEIAQNPLEQRGIAAHYRAGAHEPQTQPFAGGVRCALAADLVEDRLDGKVEDLRAHDAGVELGDVEERVEEPLQRSEEHTSELQSPYDIVC